MKFKLYLIFLLFFSFFKKIVNLVNLLISQNNRDYEYHEKIYSTSADCIGN